MLLTHLQIEVIETKVKQMVSSLVKKGPKVFLLFQLYNYKAKYLNSVLLKRFETILNK